MSIFFGHIREGRFTQGHSVSKLFAELEGKAVTIQIHEGEKRGLKQNAYLHLVLGYIAEHTGEILEVEKMNFKDAHSLYDDVQTKSGDVKRIYHRTRDMSKTKFAEVTEHLKTHSGFLGVKIPQYEDSY